MTVPARLAAPIAVAAMLLLLPAAAAARTKSVDMGVPLRAQERFGSAGADVNDFFPHSVKIRAGDSVKFRPTGFHTVDFPPTGDGPLPLIAPTGDDVSGVADAAGEQFWFNGSDALAFNQELLAGSFGKRVRHRANRRIESGLPLSEGVEPMRVKFAKRGRYRYYCNIHPGMNGKVVVKGARARVPSARRDRRRVNRQIARDLRRAENVAVAVPANTVYAGGSARGGVEHYAMLPESLTVPAGTTVRFEMSPRSYDLHTVTFGPGNPEAEPESYLGAIAATFQGDAPDPRGVYPSERPGTVATLSPGLHGNGFWSTGILDRSAASSLPEGGTVTFGSAGTYDFYCLIHPFMHGTIVVQ